MPHLSEHDAPRLQAKKYIISIPPSNEATTSNRFTAYVLSANQTPEPVIHCIIRRRFAPRLLLTRAVDLFVMKQRINLLGSEKCPGTIPFEAALSSLSETLAVISCFVAFAWLVATLWSGFYDLVVPLVLCMVLTVLSYLGMKRYEKYAERFKYGVYFFACFDSTILGLFLPESLRPHILDLVLCFCTNFILLHVYARNRLRSDDAGDSATMMSESGRIIDLYAFLGVIITSAFTACIAGCFGWTVILAEMLGLVLSGLIDQALLSRSPRVYGIFGYSLDDEEV